MPIPWGLVAYAVGALAIVGVLWAAWGQFTDWIKAPVVAELAEVRQVGSLCHSALEHQTSAVQTLKDEADRRAETSRKAAEDARKAAEVNYRAAQSFLQSGPLDPDACISAKLRAQGYVKGRK